MTDRPASWRMPSQKQMQKLAAEAAVGRNVAPTRGTGPADDMPAEYWDAVLKDGGADARTSGRPVQALKLREIARHVLRVGCRRCLRTVEIQTVDAIRLCGQGAIWKDVGRRLLNDTCTERTGRHEEDGCWPTYE